MGQPGGSGFRPCSLPGSANETTARLTALGVDDCALLIHSTDHRRLTVLKPARPDAGGRGLGSSYKPNVVHGLWSSLLAQRRGAEQSAQPHSLDRRGRYDHHRAFLFNRLVQHVRGAQVQGDGIVFVNLQDQLVQTCHKLT